MILYRHGIAVFFAGLTCLAQATENKADVDPQRAGSIASTRLTSFAKERSTRDTQRKNQIYTYLRCFYLTSENRSQPRSAYVWAVEPSSSDYFRLYGRWAALGRLTWDNLFYTDIPQHTLRSVCQSTLAQRGIRRPLLMWAAADSSMSFNYEVWHQESARQEATINRIVAFGDSLSDNQNLFNASFWRFPQADSWLRGRFSNGKVWVEYVAENLGVPLNTWAMGAAGAKPMHHWSPGGLAIELPGILEQVLSWQSYAQRAQGYQPANTLFTILIGANDLIYYGHSVQEIINTKTQALHRLINAGARNILLSTVPDVSRAPLLQERSEAEKNLLSNEVRELNRQLTTLVSHFQTLYPNVKIALFDTYNLFEEITTNPAKYNIRNTDTSCLRMEIDSKENYLVWLPARDICDNPDQFVFWDILHPTTRVHQLVAEKITQFINEQFHASSVIGSGTAR